MRERTKKSPTIDVSFQDSGSVCLFTLATKAAFDWVEENVQLDGWQWMGKSSFAVDRRFADQLIGGMSGDGLVVE